MRRIQVAGSYHPNPIGLHQQKTGLRAEEMK
jgi:hypothetical protein